MKAYSFTFLAALCLNPISVLGQSIHDVSRDYLSDANPGRVWSYGWKPSLTGAMSPLTYHLVQQVTENSGWEFWGRAIGEPSSVYRTTGPETLSSDGGAGTYPAGSVWFGPGVEPSDDRFGVIRLTVPTGQGGRYRVGVVVRTRLDVGGSDADFHVLHNTTELFRRNVIPVSEAAFTNDLSLAEGDTVDFICGRGDDEHEYGGGLKIAANISRLQSVSIRVSQVELCWATETNQSYQVQYRSALTTNQWVPLGVAFRRGTGSMQCTNDTVSAMEPRRFYQVVSITNAPPP